MIRIFLADDEPKILRGLARQIESLGLEVRIVGTASNGDLAYEAVKRVRPDLAFIDINMPKRSGLDLISDIRTLNLPMDLVIVSGYDTFEYAQKAMRLGVADYLLKPVEEADLRGVIQACQEKRGNKRSLYSPFVARVMDHLEDQYANEDLDLTTTAAVFDLSPNYLSNLVRKETGSGFIELVNGIRMTHAKEMLRNSRDVKIYEVAESCGYKSQHYFSRIFKKMMGMSPKSFQMDAE